MFKEIEVFEKVRIYVWLWESIKEKKKVKKNFLIFSFTSENIKENQI